MSSTGIIGRQGVPSLMIWMRPVVYAQADRLFRTKIQAHAGREALRSGVSQVYRAEGRSRQPVKILFSAHFGHAVGGKRRKARDFGCSLLARGAENAA